MDKRIQIAYERYKWSLAKYGQRGLDSVYKSHSSRKRAAWQYCVDKCRELNGSRLSVIGYNCFHFSVGFTFKDEEGKKYFMFITSSNDTVMEVDDE